MRAPFTLALGKPMNGLKAKGASVITASLLSICSSSGLATERLVGAPSVVGRLLLHGSKMAVHADSPSALAFFDVPPKHSVLCAEDSGDYRDQRGAHPNGGACPIVFCPTSQVSELPHREGYSLDVKLVSCKNPLLPVPRSTVNFGDWFIIQSPGYVNLDSPFFLVSTEYRGPGESGPATPKKPFHGVYGIDGKILFELKERSDPPGKVVTGLSANANGALFGIGELVTFDNGCDDETSPRKLRRLMLWEPGGNLKSIDSSKQSAAVAALMSQFRVHESHFPFYKGPDEVAKEKLAELITRFELARGTATLTLSVSEIVLRDIQFSPLEGMLTAYTEEHYESVRRLARVAALAELRRISLLARKDRSYALESTIGNYGDLSRLEFFSTNFADFVRLELKKNPEFEVLRKDAPPLDE